MEPEPATVEQSLAQLKEHPGDAQLYQHLGSLYFKRGELFEAWQAYLQSLRLNPDDPWTCLKFATLLMFCNDKQNARMLIDYAIELEPHLAVVHWSSANLHREQGQYDLAELAYQRAIEAEPNNKQALDKLAEWRTFTAGIRRMPP